MYIISIAHLYWKYNGLSFFAVVQTILTEDVCFSILCPGKISLATRILLSIQLSNLMAMLSEVVQCLTIVVLVWWWHTCTNISLVLIVVLVTAGSCNCIWYNAFWQNTSGYKVLATLWILNCLKHKFSTPGFLALELTITLTTELVQPIHATSAFSEFISTQSFQLADC